MAEIAQELVLRLDQAQEQRQLTPEELTLRRQAKLKILGLSTVRRIKLRQRSRLTWIRLGDANTRLFHLRANGRRRKNYISALSHNNRFFTAHQDKEDILHQYYQGVFGSSQARPHSLNWDLLDTQSTDLHQLDNPITEQEVLQAVSDTPSEKAPGPDGYIGLLDKKCWATVKEDLIQALHQMFSLRATQWNLLNSANVTLIPKKEGAATPADYRPISLMHSVAKIMSKLLANRLAPYLPQLVSHSQSAFIKGRSIHDNFQYVQGAINHFHKAKTAMLFLKLDIAKAFDSVRWEYMLEIMQRIGFGQRWRDLISLIWASTSSRILLNGSPGRPILHRRGLRQGDPLSPMLFIIAMDPIQKLLDMATAQGILSPISAAPVRLCISLYADDVALFIRPTRQDLHSVQQILQFFGNASGLVTNIQKSEIYKIRCDGASVNIS